VQKNDFVVDADPGNTNIITIAVPKRAEDDIHGSLRRKNMRLLRFSTARYYRESGMMNARKKIETWNAGVKDHLEAMRKVTSCGADFRAFREFMETRAAHNEKLSNEYARPRWARLRMNVHCGKQRAFAKFLNQLSPLKENKIQRLVTTYRARREASREGSTPAPSTRTYKECAHRFVTIPIEEFRASYVHHDLGCTIQRVEMERCQRIREDIENFGALTEQQMERRAQVRGFLALVSSTSGKKRMEFVHQNINAAFNIRRCAVMEKRSPQLARANFMGQPLRVKLYEEKLKPVTGGRSKKPGRRLHVSV